MLVSNTTLFPLMKPNQNYIFGIRPVIEAIESGKQLERVYIKKGLKGELFFSLFQMIRKHNIPFQYLPLEGLNRITRKNHQGIVAYLSLIEYQNLEEIIPSIFEKGSVPFLLLLDKITDVRNFGAIIRSAECAGVHAIIIPEKGAAGVNADAFKTSAGALHKINICRTPSLTKTIDYIKKCGLEVVSVTEKADKLFYQHDFTGPCVLIMGSEEKGISVNIRQISDNEVKVPVFGEIASLNVSSAASVLLYEVVRQREISREVTK